MTKVNEANYYASIRWLYNNTGALKKSQRLSAENLQWFTVLNSLVMDAGFDDWQDLVVRDPSYLCNSLSRTLTAMAMAPLDRNSDVFLARLCTAVHRKLSRGQE